MDQLTSVLPIEGDAIVLRPVGIGRYVQAAFLGIWIAFWTIFEAITLGVLGSMLLALFGFLRDSRLTTLGRSALERAPGFEAGILFIYLFLILWIGLWTLAGLAAWYRFLRLIAGMDRLAVAGGELHLSWRAGPLRRSRRFERAELRRIRVRPHDKAVVAEIGSGTTTLTDLGRVAERAAAAAWLRTRLGLDEQAAHAFDPLVAPTGWRVSRGDSGVLRLGRPTGGRRVAAMIMGGASGVGLFAAAIDISRYGVRATGALWLLALLALATAWVAWVASAMYDDTELVDCARWLESAAGFRLVK